MSAALVRALLERAKSSLRSPGQPPLHLLIGNEAADADSLVATLAHACYLASTAPPGAPAELLVPVLACPRAGLPLRREASVILAKWLGAGAAEALGLFADELGGLAPPPAAALTLLDHNSLRGPLAALQWGPCVRAILDHHVDEGAHAHVAGRARAIDFDAAAQRGVGSTCSLVALNLLGAAAEEAAAGGQGRGSSGSVLDAPLAEALLSVIALDTINMLPAKATDKDAAAVAGLQGVLQAAAAAAAAATAASGAGAGAAPPTVASLFEHLNSLRSDRQWWLSLEPAAALGLDYKGFDYGSSSSSSGSSGGGGGGVLGTCALMVGAVDFFQGGGGGALEARRLLAAQAFARERGCALLVVMSQVVAPAVAREVLLVPAGGGAALARAVAQALTGPLGARFELEAVPLQGAPEGCAALRQRNLAHTRKTLAPFLVGVLNSM
jgi:inorganic pyrophosphatase/exopolyphosphatase